MVWEKSIFYLLEGNYVSCSLNSLKGCYIGDYIGDYYRAY